MFFEFVEHINIFFWAENISEHFNHTWFKMKTVTRLTTCEGGFYGFQTILIFEHLIACYLPLNFGGEI